MELFRKLTLKEKGEFQEWARDNYQLGTLVNSAWHPVVRAECELMNVEACQQADAELLSYAN